MKKLTTTFILLFLLLSSFAQQKQDSVIFENAKNWKREIIKFPVDWAPNVKLNGFEELLFAPNWSNPKSNEFWSLVIGWKINSVIPLNLKEIESNLYGYFDGLMKPNHWSKEFPAPKIVLKKEHDDFLGTMTFFDGFHTGKAIKINIVGEQQFNEKSKKSIIIFRCSPKEYKNVIWNTLKEISLQKEDPNLITLNSSWGKEIFPFPISFAQNIHYKGIAEVRFPPKGWRNPTHENFWSYTYAWSINLNKKINSQELAINLEKYFDGLNGLDRNKNLEKFKAKATIIEIKNKENLNFFIGNIHTYDRFATLKPITLNVFIESNYCTEQQKTILLFKFSPKPFGHKTWETLGKINLNTPICN